MIWLVNLKTFRSHHKLYIQDYQFTKDFSDEFNWKTQLRVHISLEAINGNKEPIVIETKVTSKAGFIQIWQMKIHYWLKTIKFIWNHKKTGTKLYGLDNISPFSKCRTVGRHAGDHHGSPFPNRVLCEDISERYRAISNTVKEGERRASARILDQMNDLITEARLLARKNKIPKN